MGIFAQNKSYVMNSTSKIRYFYAHRISVLSETIESVDFLSFVTNTINYYAFTKKFSNFGHRS